MTCVGIIANLASGKDIRRLAAHGNVFTYMIEGTLAGMAAAVVARGLIEAPDAICQRSQPKFLSSHQNAQACVLKLGFG